MNRKRISLMFWIAGAFILAGCAPTRITLEPSFWNQTETTVAVAVASYPPLSIYSSGGQGLLDIVVTEAVSGNLKFFLQGVDPSGFSASADLISQRLNEKGFAAKKIYGLLDLAQFPKLTSQTAKNYSKIDLRSLAESEGADLLLLLSIQRMGTIRPYYGFIPLGPPKALCQAKGQLVNLKTNEILWLYAMGQNESVVSVVAPWDQPPDYPNIMRALTMAVDQAVKGLETNFFGGQGK